MNDPLAAAERRRQNVQEELEFAQAMERYCHDHQRPFPTWGEVLEVLRAVGYSKQNAPKASEANGDWQHLCATLKEERDRLQRELLEMKEEYKAVRYALYALMPSDVEFNEEEAFAQLGKGPSLREFVAELEEKYLPKGGS
ncbi:MAG TPA: hypothetical protein VEL76_08860 [Gemmataceae bacterium]|nr:hypothetical protein [Gemmataceae bacterium]